MLVRRQAVLPRQPRLSLLAIAAVACLAGPVLQAPARAEWMAAVSTAASTVDASSDSRPQSAPRPHSQLALLNATDGSA